MRTGFMRDPPRALDDRALVGLGELDHPRLRAVAEALHLEDAALAIERLLADHGADEEKHERDAEEEAGEVQYGACDGSDDQQGEDRDCDRHGRDSLCSRSARRRSGLGLTVAAELRIA